MTIGIAFETVVKFNGKRIMPFSTVFNDGVCSICSALGYNARHTISFARMGFPQSTRFKLDQKPVDWNRSRSHRYIVK